MARESLTPRVRAARPDECDALSRLAMRAKAHWGYDAATLAGWREELTITPATLADQAVRVAALDGDDRPIGFYVLQTDGDRAELAHLWVEPTFLRRGVGRRLLEHALDAAARGGARSVGVDSDPNAAAFYARLGARRTGATSAPVPGDPRRTLPRLELAVRERTASRDTPRRDDDRGA